MLTVEAGYGILVPCENSITRKFFFERQKLSLGFRPTVYEVEVHSWKSNSQSFKVQHGRPFDTLFEKTPPSHERKGPDTP